MAKNPIVDQILSRLREIRESSGLTASELDEVLVLGPGWTSRFESGEAVPTLDVLVVLLDALGSSLDEVLQGVNETVAVPDATTSLDRFIHAEADGEDLMVHFQYAAYDARYRLQNASEGEFETVIKTLRDGLALLATGTGDDQQIKTNAVARAFLKAVELWPEANPSDLWWFVISRAYLDPFNHPAAYARLDLGQSWKRTAGWALEEVLVRHYRDALAAHSVRIFIGTTAEKRQLLAQLEVGERLEADKVDVLLVGEVDGLETCFGVVHVKASFAERRTDDVPMSKALVEAGYTSPLWTMDCKSVPAAQPYNRGELGLALSGAGDSRSAKRIDIEDDRFFSACFSYNVNTVPTPVTQTARAPIIVCTFTDAANDPFTTFVADAWASFRRSRLGAS